MPETGPSNANKGSSYFSKIYYSDVQSFSIDNTYVVNYEKAYEPYCYYNDNEEKRIYLNFKVNARFDNPPRDYALSDWGVVVYRDDVVVSKKSIGIGNWDGTVTFSIGTKNLNIDKTNFTAKTLGKWFVSTYRTYSADGYSGTTYSEERYPIDLTYNLKPSLEIYDLSVGSTVPISEGDWDTQTSYTFGLEVLGAFWMDEIYRYYVGNWDKPGKNGSYTLGDGAWKWESENFWVKYSSESQPHSSYSYFGAMVNGKEIQSNRIIYNFNGPSCNISLSGSGATKASTENTHHADMVNSIAPTIGMSMLAEPVIIFNGEGRKLDENLIED